MSLTEQHSNECVEDVRQTEQSCTGGVGDVLSLIEQFHSDVRWRAAGLTATPQ